MRRLAPLLLALLFTACQPKVVSSQPPAVSPHLTLSRRGKRCKTS